MLSTSPQTLMQCVFKTFSDWNCIYQYKNEQWMFFKIVLFGGARGVMVIVVGNGHGDSSSNPGQDWLHFT